MEQNVKAREERHKKGNWDDCSVAENRKEQPNCAQAVTRRKEQSGSKIIQKNRKASLHFVKDKNDFKKFISYTKKEKKTPMNFMKEVYILLVTPYRLGV